MKKTLMTAASSCPTRATLQRVINVEAQGEQGRGEAKRDRCYRRSYKGPSENMPVESEIDPLAILGNGPQRKPVGGPTRDND